LPKNITITPAIVLPKKSKNILFLTGPWDGGGGHKNLVVKSSFVFDGDFLNVKELNDAAITANTFSMKHFQIASQL